MPTTCDGFEGSSERILSVVLTRFPPMIRSYSRPSWPRTLAIAERILRALSSRVKSKNGSVTNGPSCKRTRGRGGASRVAIGKILSGLEDFGSRAFTDILHLGFGSDESFRLSAISFQLLALSEIINLALNFL